MNFVGFVDAIADAIDSDPAPALWWVVYAGSGVQIVCVPADASDAAVQRAVQEKTGDETHVHIEKRCAADREFRVSRIDDRERLIALAASCLSGNAKWRDIVASWQLCNPVSSWLGAKFEGNTVVQLKLSRCGLTGKLDVSSCAALTHLHCGNNQLQALNVSGCVALTHLHCGNNQLQALDVSGCVALTRLQCYNNLHCGRNQLQALDVSSCVALTQLYCNNNHLRALDVSSCVELTQIFCDCNQLQALDVLGCVALAHLFCSNNQLQALHVSSCVTLTQLFCYCNQLQALDVLGCVALTYLYCGNNHLQALDASGCVALTHLRCHNNQLQALDVSNCVALKPPRDIQIDRLAAVIMIKSCGQPAIGCRTKIVL
jgi:Leucine-rich repeat (LRR) protein